MSAAILGVLANAPAIIEFIQQAIALGINAWDQIVPMVQNDSSNCVQKITDSSDLTLEPSLTYW